MLDPALRLPDRVRLIVHEASGRELFGRLADHSLDVVLTDAPIPPHSHIKAYSHLLGECGVSWFAVDRIARGLRRNFPKSLSAAPVLLPIESTTMRRGLDTWFEKNALHPSIVAEFADSALLKAFGQEGHGAFPAPTAIEDEIKRQYGVQIVGRVDEMRERFYAISVERRIKHPAVAAISTAARDEIFDS